MKVAVVGCRKASFDHYKLIEENIPKNVTEIISGGAVGTDVLAKKFAIDNKIPYREFLPDYNIFSRGAPIIRNRQIVKEANYVLCLWDGKSKGTKSVISLCLKLNKFCKIIPLNGQKPYFASIPTFSVNK